MRCKVCGHEAEECVDCSSLLCQNPDCDAVGTVVVLAADPCENCKKNVLPAQIAVDHIYTDFNDVVNDADEVSMIIKRPVIICSAEQSAD